MGRHRPGMADDVTEHLYQKLGPDDTLVVKFTRRMDAQEVGEWVDRFSSAYPDRRAIVVDKDTEYRIEPRSPRKIDLYFAAAIAIFLIDIVVRIAL